jgi:nitrate reductase gamma subunit
VVPYLRSLFLFQPDVQRMAELPLIVRLHVVGAFALFSAFSFTRLVHALVAPVPYLWRPLQVVIWNRRRGERLAA